MAKKFKAVVKLQIPAGKANPAPPIGPALGNPWYQHHGILQGIQCQNTEQNGADHSCRDHRLPGRFVHFHSQIPANRFLLSKAAGVEKGSGEPNRDNVGKITRAQVREIAEIKMKDMNAIDIEGAMRQIEGTARNMGITILKKIIQID